MKFLFIWKKQNFSVLCSAKVVYQVLRLAVPFPVFLLLVSFFSLAKMNLMREYALWAKPKKWVALIRKGHWIKREEPCLCLKGMGQIEFNFQWLIKKGVAVLTVGLHCVVWIDYGKISDSPPGRIMLYFVPSIWLKKKKKSFWLFGKAKLH